MGKETRIAPRIYLAGPEVFLPEAPKFAAEKCGLAASYGLVGVFPVDNSLQVAGLGKNAQARRIAAANEDLMRSCDGLIANLTPFRGVSMDCGTAFEVGFMRALGRPVVGYTAVVEDYASRVSGYRLFAALPFDGDRPEHAVEDFGGVENLMVTSAIEASGMKVAIDVNGQSSLSALGGFADCLAEMRDHFLANGR